MPHLMTNAFFEPILRLNTALDDSAAMITSLLALRVSLERVEQLFPLEVSLRRRVSLLDRFLSKFLLDLPSFAATS